MNDPDENLIVEDVVVSNGKKTYYGKAFFDDVVGTPAVVFAAGKSMYWEVWESQGWTVDYEK